MLELCIPHLRPFWAGCVPPEVSAPRGDKLGHVRSLIGDEINAVSSDSGDSALTSLRRY